MKIVRVTIEAYSPREYSQEINGLATVLEWVIRSVISFVSSRP